MNPVSFLPLLSMPLLQAHWCVATLASQGPAHFISSRLIPCFESPSCPLFIYSISLSFLSQSLSINKRDKPQTNLPKAFCWGWRSHRNDTYSLSFQTTLMAYWRACRLTDYCICVCTLGGECTVTSVCVLIQLPSIFYHSDHSEEISTCPFFPPT